MKSGACDSLVPGSGQAIRRRVDAARRRSRARLFAAIDGACEHGSRTQRDKDLGQIDLFGGGDDGRLGGPAIVPLPDVPPWTEIEQLNYEKDALGLYWSGHRSTATPTTCATTARRRPPI